MDSIKSFNACIEKSIKDNWDKDALTDYLGATLQYHDVARKIEKLHSHPLKTIFQHKACTDKLYADSFYKVQKNSHSSFEVICCRS